MTEPLAYFVLGFVCGGIAFGLIVWACMMDRAADSEPTEHGARPL